MSPNPPESRNQLLNSSFPVEDSRLGKMAEVGGDGAAQVEPPKLATLLKETDLTYATKPFCKLLIVDCRRFLDYNTSHIRSAINVCCSKLVRRRLQENKMSALDLLLQQLMSCGLITSSAEVPNVDVVLYDQQTMEPLVMLKEKSKSFPPPAAATAPVVCQPLKAKRTSNGGKKLMRCGSAAAQMDDSTFLSVLMEKLSTGAEFSSVKILKGGFLDFQARYPELCEGAVPAAGGMIATPGRGAPAKLSLTSLSQPCLPVSSSGPTRILPFLYLGSQQDAMDPETLQKYGIDYVINLSSNCPKPPFLSDAKFLRIAVNDSYTEKLLPHFENAFEFLDKVRESNACVLVHCLAGISRSPTVAIAYIMRHLHMTSEDAYRYIKEKRPSISPNFNFLGQLLEYERRLKEYREKNISEQLKGSLRKVLVPPTPGPKTSPPSMPELASEAPVTFTSPPNSAREIATMKRSISCPVKIHKTGKETEVSTAFQPSETPSSEININGKRKMGIAEDVSDVEMVSSHQVSWASKSVPAQATVSSAERPRGLGGLRSRRGLNIPNPVQEDLPSPSTELSKLTFTGASVVATVAPPTGDSGRDQPTEQMMETDQTEKQIFLPPFPTPHRAEQEPEGAKNHPEEVQIGGVVGHAATNPFFANLPKPSTPRLEGGDGDHLGSLIPQQNETGNVAVTIPLPSVTVSSVSVEKSRWRTISEPVESCSLSVENPLFPSRKPKKFRFGAYAKAEKKTVSPKQERKSEKTHAEAATQQFVGISQRISHFLRKAQAVPLMSAAAAGITAESGSFSFFSLGQSKTGQSEGVVRSATNGGLSTNVSQVAGPAPPKSKSESGCLYSMCEDLESPESGFVESPMADSMSGNPYGRDPERESISSTSSLEIAVN